MGALIAGHTHCGEHQDSDLQMHSQLALSVCTVMGVAAGSRMISCTCAGTGAWAGCWGSSEFIVRAGGRERGGNKEG